MRIVPGVTTTAVVVLFILCATAAGAAGAAGAESPALYSVDCAQTRLGAIPAAWRVLVDDRANPSWAVDGRGLLRTIVKNYEGLIVYDGVLADGGRAAELVDGVAEVTFKKTIDETVTIGVVGRLQDAQNYYAIRFRGFN